MCLPTGLRSCGACWRPGCHRTGRRLCRDGRGRRGRRGYYLRRLPGLRNHPARRWCCTRVGVPCLFCGAGQRLRGCGRCSRHCGRCRGCWCRSCRRWRWRRRSCCRRPCNRGCGNGMGGRRRCRRHLVRRLSWPRERHRCPNSGCSRTRRRRRRRSPLLLFAFALFFPLLNRLQNVARLGYPRPVDLAPVGAAIRSLGRTPAIAAAALKMRAHTFGLIAFERARVRLGTGHSHCVQNIQNRPALYFQLAR